ncbi:hypothetical protein YC2023_010798 [Brassica napus]
MRREKRESLEVRGRPKENDRTKRRGRVVVLGALLHSKILPYCDISSNEPEAYEEVEMITQRLQEVEKAELKQSHEENLQFQKTLENMETIVQSITNLNV